MGVVAVVTGTMIEKQMNTILVILVAAGIGTLVGAINGLIIAKLHIPDMLATLATGNIWKAVIFGLLGGKWLTSCGIRTVLLHIYVPKTGTLYLCDRK